MTRLRRLDLDLLGNQERVVHIDPEITDRTLDLGMTEKELDGPEVACPSVNH